MHLVKAVQFIWRGKLQAGITGKHLKK